MYCFLNMYDIMYEIHLLEVLFMGIYKQKHAVSGIVYVYSREKETDEITGKTKIVRRVIGKIDPESGKQVPTGAVGRPSKQQNPSSKGNYSGSPSMIETNESLEISRQLIAMQQEIESLRDKCKQQDEILHEIAKLVQNK